jgi:hypothetical protein
MFTASVTDGKPLNADNVSNALPLAISTPLLLKP